MCTTEWVRCLVQLTCTERGTKTHTHMHTQTHTHNVSHILLPQSVSFYHCIKTLLQGIIYSPGVCVQSVTFVPPFISVSFIPLQYFRREETNFISQNEIDNMTLIMPTASSRNRQSTAPDPVSSGGGKVKVGHLPTSLTCPHSSFSII